MGAGAEPHKRIEKYAPPDWKERVTLVSSGSDYHKAYDEPVFGGILFDPHYEAKALPFLQDGDCFWVIGIRQKSGIIPSHLSAES